MLLQLFDEAILGNQSRPRILDEHFQLHGTRIDTRSADLFKREPVQMLNLFLQIADHPEITGISSACLRQLREARRSQVYSLQELPECRKLFMSLLRHPNGMALPITLMHEHGILSTYLCRNGSRSSARRSSICSMPTRSTSTPTA